MRLDAFWSSAEWATYEAIYGDAPGTRAALIASATWRTRVLDLRPDERTLWRDVRRSYHSLVNRLTKDDHFMICAVGGPEFLTTCWPMQLRKDGCESRRVESWHVQAGWLNSGSGVGRCFVAKRDGVPVAFVYMIVWRGVAHYGFARSEESYANHALLWHAICTLKRGGTAFLDLGWQGHATDNKGIGIEYFKTGWGGRDLTFNEELW